MPVARGGYFGLYIEMKWGKNEASQEQLKYMVELRNQGYAVWLCRGAKVAEKCIEQYMKFPKTEIKGSVRTFEEV